MHICIFLGSIVNCAFGNIAPNVSSTFLIVSIRNMFVCNLQNTHTRFIKMPVQYYDGNLFAAFST